MCENRHIRYCRLELMQNCFASGECTANVAVPLERSNAYRFALAQSVARLEK